MSSLKLGGKAPPSILLGQLPPVHSLLHHRHISKSGQNDNSSTKRHIYAYGLVRRFNKCCLSFAILNAAIRCIHTEVIPDYVSQFTRNIALTTLVAHIPSTDFWTFSYFFYVYDISPIFYPSYRGLLLYIQLLTFNAKEQHSKVHIAIWTTCMYVYVHGYMYEYPNCPFQIAMATVSV